MGLLYCFLYTCTFLYITHFDLASYVYFFLFLSLLKVRITPYLQPRRDDALPLAQQEPDTKTGSLIVYHYHPTPPVGIYELPEGAFYLVAM